MDKIIEETLAEGLAMQVAGEFELASQIYGSVLKLRPNHAPANHRMGLLKADAGHDLDALPYLQTALEADTSISQFWVSYVKVLTKLNRVDEAARVLSLAKESGAAGEEFLELHQRLVVSRNNPIEPAVTTRIKDPSQEQLQNLINLYQQGLFKQTLGQASLLLLEFPSSVVLYNIQGAANIGLGLPNIAINSFKQAIKIKPDSVDAYNNLGLALKEQGKLEEAIQAYNKVLAINPNYVQAHSNRGLVLKDQGKLEEAIQAFDRALAIKPDLETTYFNKGLALKEQEKLEEAIEAYNKAIVIKPDYARAFNNMGLALKDQGKLEEAIEAYNKAIVLNPDYAAAYINAGISLQEQGQLEESIEAYNKALSINPNFAEAYNNLGIAFKEKGKMDEAIEHCKKALSIRPDYADAHNNIGVALQEKGELQEAIKSYKQALIINPNFRDAALNLVKLPAGKLKVETLDLCNKVSLALENKLDQTSEFLFFQANLLKHQGSLDQSFNKFYQANKTKLEEVEDLIKIVESQNKQAFHRLKRWRPNILPLKTQTISKLFILGPSRSGKSLLERILSKSSKVLPLYENIQVSALTKKLLSEKTSDKLRFEMLFYHNERALLFQNYELITSTSPGSIFHADYLADMIPNAYFIIVNRDPRDLASEIFTHEYLRGNFYSYDPIEIIRYLNVYQDASNTLASKIPDRCITVNFEDVIGQPTETLEKIGQLTSSKLEPKYLKLNTAVFLSESPFRKHFTAITDTF